MHAQAPAVVVKIMLIIIFFGIFVIDALASKSRSDNNRNSNDEDDNLQLCDISSEELLVYLWDNDEGAPITDSMKYIESQKAHGIMR